MNILIIRLSAIGDIFFCTSLLRGLKERYPGCRITWATEPMGATILDGHPLLDNLLVLPRKDWTQSFRSGRWIHLLKSLLAFQGELREEHYDLVIDPQGLLKSAIWARRSRADLRIGVKTREGSSLLYDEVLKVPVTRRPLILTEYRELMKRFGGDDAGVRMSLNFSPEKKKEAEAFLQKNGAVDPIVFCPFTTRPQKHWFNESWAALGNLLQEKALGPVVILGGPEDGENAKSIASAMKEPGIIAAGKPRSIGFALALISEAKALVGVDTGLTHAGIGLERPTIGLFGSTRPYLETGVSSARILYHEMECSPCHRRPTCDGRFDCMRKHTPENVMKNLLQVMRVH